LKVVILIAFQFLKLHLFINQVITQIVMTID